MNLSKKLIAFIISIILIFSLSACNNGVQQGGNAKDIKISITVSAKTLLSHLDAKTNLGEEKFEELKKQDGLILKVVDITVKNTEKLHDILKKELDAISVVYSIDSSFLGAYIKSIDSIAEKQFGGGSGWQYFVNEDSPSYAISAHKLKDGDIIEFLYTCNMGNDLKK